MIHKRILLKLSGEVLAGEKGFGIVSTMLDHYIKEIQQVHREGFEVAVVIGGGNIWRGNQAEALGLNKVHADHMGMLATMINAVALRSKLVAEGLPACLMSRLTMQRICEGYCIEKGINHLCKGRILIIGGGTSNPCFTTDSAAALTAIELKADVLVKGTDVEGVYTADPKKDLSAQFCTSLTLQAALDKKLKVLDMAALLLCLEQQLPVIVYNATKKGLLLNVLQTGKGGTCLRV